MFQFGERSELNLKGVHHDLIAVCRHALLITPVDFIVTFGLRTMPEQTALYAQGRKPLGFVNDLRKDAGMPPIDQQENTKQVTQTMNSRHIGGYAIDVAALLGKAVSYDQVLYKQIAEAMKTASYALGVPIVWGGDWKSKDSSHFELSKDKYP